jgi:RsiW-degrading membrane proteinase PrsW (M82 family)
MLFLLLPVVIAALPVFVAFFLRKRLGVSVSLFLLCLLIGTITIAPAAVAQYFIPPSPSVDIKGFLFNVFCRIAFTEEFSRFLLLLSFFSFLNTLKRTEDAQDTPRSTAMGLVAGLGFALAESAAYSADSVQATLLRGFTAAPMHAACGARVGAAVSSLKKSPALSVWRFLFAVAIHGTYNILVVSPGITRFFSVLLIFSALFSALKETKSV